jgi:hypothetical protein
LRACKGEKPAQSATFGLSVLDVRNPRVAELMYAFCTRVARQGGGDTIVRTAHTHRPLKRPLAMQKVVRSSPTAASESLSRTTTMVRGGAE